MADAASAWTVRVLARSGEPPSNVAAAYWRALEQASPQHTPFATTAYAEAVGAALGIGYALYGVEHVERRELDVGFLAFERKQGPVRRVVVPPFTPFTPILTRTLPDEARLHRGTSPLGLLIDHLATVYDDLALHLSPEMADARPFQWRGWQAQPLYTYELPLTGDPLARWSATARRQHRKEEGAYEVAVGTPDQVVALSAASYERNGRDLPAAKAQLAVLAEQVCAAGLGETWVATRRATGQAEAAVLVLRDKLRAYYWLAGSVPGAAMTVLLGVLLPALQEQGIPMFDYVGANTPSIAEFKRRMGGTLRPYLRLTYTPNRFVAAVRRLRGG